MKAEMARMLAAIVCATTASGVVANSQDSSEKAVELGPRPYYLVEQMNPGPLKDALQLCAAKTVTFKPSDFSIGHRGAALMFPEHTEESYRAAAKMGAGIVECFVDARQVDFRLLHNGYIQENEALAQVVVGPESGDIARGIAEHRAGFTVPDAFTVGA